MSSEVDSGGTVYVRTPEQVAHRLAPWHGPAPPRPPVEHTWVWASLQKDPGEVLAETFREALWRDPERRKTWVGLVDDNQTQLDLLGKLARKHQVQLTVVLDLIHVAEYLWSAAVAFHDEASPQREPIASGAIESACWHLVCDRMDKASRWSLAGAEAVLRLRALRSSGDFAAYWDCHVAQEYQRNHVDHYADGNVVPVRPHHANSAVCEMIKQRAFVVVQKEPHPNGFPPGHHHWAISDRPTLAVDRPSAGGGSRAQLVPPSLSTQLAKHRVKIQRLPRALK